MFQDELQTKNQNATKTFSSVCISVDSSGQEIIVFDIPVMSKKNQINAQGLNNSNCIIENLPFDCKCSTMKIVVDGVLSQHATQRIIKDIISKKVIIKITAPISKIVSRTCNTDIYLFAMAK